MTNPEQRKRRRQIVEQYQQERIYNAWIVAIVALFLAAGFLQIAKDLGSPTDERPVFEKLYQPVPR